MINEVEKHGSINFTVIIPAFNAENTIGRALDSVLAQTYPAFEIIVVDDASKDRTREILETKYAGQIKCIYKLFNAGSSVARNAGLDVARGDYIAFLDADDIWHQDKLMLINTILTSKPGISLFYHPYTQEQIVVKKLPEDIVLYKLPFIKLLPGNFIATSCAVIRNGLSFRFEPSMRYTEDFDLWLRIGYKYKIYFINIPLTQIFRPYTSKGGISENKWKMRKGEMRAYRRLVNLNPLFVFLLPFLLLTSLGKHLVKKVIVRR
jgi:glycosyltransferase involved in cell wall biosynthesis